MRTIGLVMLLAVAVSAAAGCGDDSAASGTVESPTAATTATTVTQSMSDSATTSTSASASALGGRRCGTVPGPEGALSVVVFAGDDIGCGGVMPVAQAYAPSIASGSPQTVQGWECGPSQTRGVLSRCTRGDDTFGFMPE